MLLAKLIKDQITSLKKANNAATKQRQRKKKQIQNYGTLTKEAREDRLAQEEAKQQIQREQRQGRE